MTRGTGAHCGTDYQSVFGFLKLWHRPMAGERIVTGRGWPIHRVAMGGLTMIERDVIVHLRRVPC